MSSDRHHSNAALKQRRCLIPALAFAALVGMAASASAGPYRDGQYIDITGTVSDPSGMPIPDIRVVFKATRRAFSVTKFQRTTRDQVRQSAETDPHGQFSFRWRWLDYYNRFEILVGVPKRSAASESFEVLSKLDISERIRSGTPVVVSLVVEDSGYLDSLRDFLASLDTEDEKRIYEEMGSPDRVQKIELPSHDEISWWYFRDGKAYRFRDGGLQQVVHFEPIRPFGS